MLAITIILIFSHVKVAFSGAGGELAAAEAQRIAEAERVAALELETERAAGLEVAAVKEEPTAAEAVVGAPNEGAGIAEGESASGRLEMVSSDSQGSTPRQEPPPTVQESEVVDASLNVHDPAADPPPTLETITEPSMLTKAWLGVKPFAINFAVTVGLTAAVIAVASLLTKKHAHDNSCENGTNIIQDIPTLSVESCTNSQFLVGVGGNTPNSTLFLLAGLSALTSFGGFICHGRLCLSKEGCCPDNNAISQVFITDELKTTQCVNNQSYNVIVTKNNSGNSIGVIAQDLAYIAGQTCNVTSNIEFVCVNPEGGCASNSTLKHFYYTGASV